MPELPEVETIRLGLQRYLVGHTIEDIDIRLPKMVSGDKMSIIGAQVKAVRRFGKGLVIDLDNQFSIAIHIKMTGQLIYVGPASNAAGAKLSEKVGGELPHKHTHVIFTLSAKRLAQSEKAMLYYNDIRKFGWMKIVKSDKLQDISFFNELGPEIFPSSGQEPLTLSQFKVILSKAKGPIKPLLMDQKKIGGVGNIYANDALFFAKIDPRTRAKALSGDQIKKLYDSILHVLKEGLKYGGATELNYVNALGQEGKYQEHFLVYGREKEPCRVCKTPIEKFKLAGRGTYFCTNCQD